MGAYVALTSLMGTIQQLQLLQSNLDLWNNHVENLNLLYEKVDSLQEFLDISDGEQMDNLHAKVKHIANEAEDEVESQMKVVMEEQDGGLHQKEALERLFEILQRAIGNIDSLKEEVFKHSQNNNLRAGNSSFGDSSSPRLHASTFENDMVGYNFEQEKMLSQLTSGSTQMEVISVTGMGGIGKSTFAKKLFSHPSVLSFFDICGWVTVSEDYSYRKMLLGLLKDANIGMEEELDKKSDSNLAVCLKQSLMSRRYLIVVDDIWSKKAWDDIRLCLPDDDKRSRVLLTTRDVEVAQYASSPKDPFQMHLLDTDDSWNLFYQKALAEKGFPIEFEDVGKEVAKNCKGLPLMISVVAKVLSSKRTLEEWRKVAESVSSLANVDAYQQCSGVLALSYKHLPSYLKACFLYFGVFSKASEISVEKLIRLWIAEGLLKVKGMKGLEEVAALNLNYLIDKSLVIVSKRSFDGKIMTCMIHDLVHDFSLREADSQSLLYIQNTKINERGWVFPLGCRWVSQQFLLDSDRYQFHDLAHSKLRSVSFYRSYRYVDIAKYHFKLLRVLDVEKNSFFCFPQAILDLVLLRYLALRISDSGQLPISKLLNLQTLTKKRRITLFRKTYKLFLGWHLLVAQRKIFEGIKKVRKLEIAGKEQEFLNERGWDNNLEYLKELEALNVAVRYHPISFAMHVLIKASPGSFPPNLKKLTLSGTRLPWNGMNSFSKLPNLEPPMIISNALSVYTSENADTYKRFQKDLQIV
ncbi:putative late blight resistance protein homolog R1B-17 [Nicotiana tabacum]|uniref:Late blight resistance protein homolog R1B-17 n=1 Tax=Nicotiana tabacum TaxID=4097 RepID=A0AC58S005_TOBAC